MVEIEQRDMQLRQSPDLVLVHRGGKSRVHFGRVGKVYAWQSYDTQEGQLEESTRRYAGMTFIENPEEAERLFRRLAASNGFTREPQVPSRSLNTY